MDKNERRELIYAVITLVSLILFEICNEYALKARGFSAYGGEYFILLIPLLAYTIEVGVKGR